jgi:aspartate 1-decarboxylase
VGDEVIVIAYAELTPKEARQHHPRVVHVDENNDVTKTRTLDVSTEDDAIEAPDGMEDVLIA